MLADIYYDYPYEDMCLRIDHPSLKTYTKFYGQPESLVDGTSNLCEDIINSNDRITKEQYGAK
jgi:hypothetical protein